MNVYVTGSDIYENEIAEYFCDLSYESNALMAVGYTALKWEVPYLSEVVKSTFGSSNDVN